MEKSGKIYERVGDLIYERDVGSTKRNLTAKSALQCETTRAKILENQLWNDIRQAAKTNITLQSALDQCIMIYKLSKENKNDI